MWRILLLMGFPLVVAILLDAFALFTDAQGICADCDVSYPASGGSLCCDEAFYSNFLTCTELETLRGWDCSGCNCPEEEVCTNCLGSDCEDTLSWIGDGECDSNFNCADYNFGKCRPENTGERTTHLRHRHP